MLGCNTKGDNYFIEADQYMVTGWKTLDKNTYYFKTEAEDTNKDGSYGYRVSDWWMIDEKWYYFDSDGAMVTSKVIHCKGKEYYVGSDGVMVVNKTIVDPESNQTYTANVKDIWGSCSRGSGRSTRIGDTKQRL